VPTNNPVPDAVGDHWDDLLEDARATATEYRERGWDVLLLHTADATVVDGRLDVLVPDNEYEEVAALAQRLSFDNSRAFSTERGGVRFVLVVVEASEAAQAVAVPAYIPVADDPQLAERGQETGELSTQVRALSSGTHVSFTHEDPALLLSD